MSAEVGGRSGKLGDAYERLWAVHHAIRLMAGQLHRLRWEPLGAGLHGVDLELVLPNGLREGHQLKRQQSDKAKWTMADLIAEHVPQDALKFLHADLTGRFVFVSSDPAATLKDLCDRAPRESDAETFYLEHVRASKPRLRDFERLLKVWGLDPDDPTDRSLAHQLLIRVSCQVVDRGQPFRDFVHYMASLQLSGDPGVAVGVIGKYLDDHLGRDVFADDLLRHLQLAKIHPRNMRLHPGAASSVIRLSDSFEAELEAVVIGGAILPRQEATDIVEAIRGADPPKLMIVHGGAGAGKSALMLEVVTKLKVSEVPYLAIQLHTHRPIGTPSFYGASVLDLPGSPAHCLGGVAAGRRSVLLLDQIDSLRFTSVHSSEAWSACLRVIDEAMAIPEMTVVLACRSFDLENDPNIKRVRTRRDASTVEVAVGPLSDEVVAAVVNEAHGDYGLLSLRARKLLTHPQTLAMWRELADKHGRNHHLTTTTELTRRFLATRRREAEVFHNVSASEINHVIQSLLGCMEESGRLEAPEAVVSPAGRALDALCSTGVLRRRGTAVSFVHQSYFDHLVAERVLCEVGTKPSGVIEWLIGDQSLSRRDQLRQLLFLLRDGDPAGYAAIASSILADAKIRFHIQHLVLGVLRDAPEPMPEEVDLVLALLRRPGESSLVYRRVLQSQVAWFDAFSKRGCWAELLSSPSREDRDRALRMLASVVSARASEVDLIITSLWPDVMTWPDCVAEALPWNSADDSPALAEYRRLGVRRGKWPMGDLAVDRVASRTPERVVLLVHAAIRQAFSRIIRGEEHDGMHWREPVLAKGVLRAIQRDSAGAWRHLGRLAVTAARLERRHRACRPASPIASEYARWRVIDHGPLSILEVLVKHTAAGLAARHPERLADMLVQSDACGSDHLDRAIASGLVGAQAGVADIALSWLMREPRRYFLGDGVRMLRTSPAREIIQALSPLCSDRVFGQLESELLMLHGPGERTSFESQAQYLKTGDFGYLNRWGHAQHMLMSALPIGRMSKTVRHRVSTWRTKFGDPALERAHVQKARGGVIRSPIPLDHLTKVSDNEWLRIVSGAWEGRSQVEWRKIGLNVMGQRSHSHFAADLGECAKRQPGRFAVLALRLPISTHPAYWARLMAGIGAADADGTGCSAPATTSEIAAVIEHIGRIDDAEYARCACRVVADRSTERWPDGVIDALEAFSRHQDPVAPEVVEPEDVETAIEGMATTAINCVRGCAAGTVRMLIADQPSLRQRLVPTARRLLADPHPAVRHEALGIACGWFMEDPHRGVEWLLAGCDHDDDRVLCSHWLGWMLRHVLLSHLDAVTPLITRMTKSPNARVAENGAAWTTAVWVQTGKLEWLLNQARFGSLSQRRGVTDAARQLICDPGCAVRCAELVRAGALDEDASVQEVAYRSLFQDGVLDLSEAPSLLMDLARSHAFLYQAGTVVHVLSEYPGSIVRFEEAVLKIAEQVSRSQSDEAYAARRRMIADGGDVSALLLRLYDARMSDSDRSRAYQVLDAWDSLLRAGFGGAEQHLDSLD